MSKEDTKKEEVPELSREEKAFYIKSLWASLIKPKWFKNDLIDFGTAIFAGKSLKQMDDGTYGKIFPFLETMAVHFAGLLRTEAERQLHEHIESESKSEEKKVAEVEKSLDETKEKREEKEEKGGS